MAVYFYCPGQAEYSSTQLTCSVPLELHQESPIDWAGLTGEVIHYVLLYSAIIFVFLQIKKAIEQS